MFQKFLSKFCHLFIVGAGCQLIAYLNGADSLNKGKGYAGLFIEKTVVKAAKKM